MTRNPKIRILLADDHGIVLEGLRALLDSESDMTVVAATTEGAQVLPLVRKHRPEVVVLDYELGGMRATDIIGDLRAMPDAPRVLVLTAYHDGETIRSVLEFGAEGLALKTASPQQTLSAIRQVMDGQLVFPPAARRWLEARGTRGTRGGIPDLTVREREVWALLAEGLTNVQIAARLSLSENTVKFHVQHLYQKLGVKNRTEAALRHQGPGGATWNNAGALSPRRGAAIFPEFQVPGGFNPPTPPGPKGSNGT
jgi:DNA-binding NarL/FixJ family response regulator